MLLVAARRGSEVNSEVFLLTFRTLTGLGMLVCSMDGTVAYLDFSLDELGDPLSEEEKVKHAAAICSGSCYKTSDKVFRLIISD